MNHSRPPRRKRKSPGSLPSPSFSSQGRKPANRTSARKTTSSQRITGPPCSANGNRSPSQRMAPIADRKTDRIERTTFRQAQDLEELAHLVLGEQLLRGGKRGDAGAVQQFENAAVHQEAGLRGVADHLETGILRRERDAGEVDMRG